MSIESAYNKKLRPESTMDKVEGILEHLNLPPGAIEFVRRNQKILQVVIVLVIIFVVAGSLYKSYREKKIEEAATQLSLAINSDEGSKKMALEHVVQKYSSTGSALWAEIELGHLAARSGSYDQAIIHYNTVLEDIDEKNPLFALLVYGKAQTFEAAGKYTEAEAQYDLLKDITGYAHLAYIGKGRIKEVQGDTNKAIAIYNNYLLTLGDEPQYAQQKAEMNARIARLKALQ